MNCEFMQYYLGIIQVLEFLFGKNIKIKFLYTYELLYNGFLKRPVSRRANYLPLVRLRTTLCPVVDKSNDQLHGRRDLHKDHFNLCFILRLRHQLELLLIGRSCRNLWVCSGWSCGGIHVNVWLFYFLKYRNLIHIKYLYL